jgi:hypothetical protein
MHGNKHIKYFSGIYAKLLFSETLYFWKYNVLFETKYKQNSISRKRQYLSALASLLIGLRPGKSRGC